MGDGDFPVAGVELSLLLVVSDIERARWFYRDVLGATLYREYGGTSAVFQFQGVWILAVTGGGPTVDKPDVTLAPPADPNMVSAELTLRVPNCQGAYEVLKARGAQFLTPPLKSDWGGEIRCFFRDPDGHLLEISQLLYLPQATSREKAAGARRQANRSGSCIARSISPLMAPAVDRDRSGL